MVRWALMALALAGCVAQHERTPTFCDLLAEAQCESAARCGCPNLDDCVERALYHCEARRLEAAIEAGDIVYDEAAARAYVDRYRASCDPWREGWRSSERVTWFGSFVGTRGPGEPCEARILDGPSECRLGAICSRSVCVALAEDGGACGPDTGGCESVWTEGGLRFCIEGICRPYLTVGEPCEADPPARNYCSTFRCVDGACAARLANGEPCPAYGCASYRCEGVCAAPELDGSLCDDDFDCASRSCRGGTCQRPAPDSEACDGRRGCESGVCAGGICTQPICVAAGLI